MRRYPVTSLTRGCTPTGCWGVPSASIPSLSLEVGVLGPGRAYRAVGEPNPGRRAALCVSVDSGLYWTLPVFLVAKVRIRLLTCPGTQSPHLGCWGCQLGKETRVWLSVQGPYKVQHSEEGEGYKETQLKEDWVGSGLPKEEESEGLPGVHLLWGVHLQQPVVLPSVRVSR